MEFPQDIADPGLAKFLKYGSYSAPEQIAVALLSFTDGNHPQSALVLHSESPSTWEVLWLMDSFLVHVKGVALGSGSGALAVSGWSRPLSAIQALRIDSQTTLPSDGLSSQAEWVLEVDGVGEINLFSFMRNSNHEPTDNFVKALQRSWLA